MNLHVCRLLRLLNGCLLSYNMGIKHVPFIARTVLVVNQNAEEALRLVNRLCTKEDILGQYRRTRRYEKPFMVRTRINYERCRALYNEEMTRKIKFLSRKNRTDPFPGS